jgi:hypothetical protein
MLDNRGCAYAAICCSVLLASATTACSSNPRSAAACSPRRRPPKRLNGFLFGCSRWGGINNTYFWIDPSRGIAGVILMQYLPFADVKALAVYDAFERGAYQLVSAER